MRTMTPLISTFLYSGARKSSLACSSSWAVEGGKYKDVLAILHSVPSQLYCWLCCYNRLPKHGHNIKLQLCKFCQHTNETETYSEVKHSPLNSISKVNSMLSHKTNGCLQNISQCRLNIIHKLSFQFNFLLRKLLTM